MSAFDLVAVIEGSMRVTLAVAVVLRAFLAEPAEQRYGYDLMKQTAFGSSKLYPILDRLEKAGWLRRDRETVDPAVAGRPSRVFYQLTGQGQRAARLELAALNDRLRTPARRIGKLTPGMGAR